MKSEFLVTAPGQESCACALHTDRLYLNNSDAINQTQIK